MTLDATTIEQVEQFLTPFTLSTSSDIDERTGHEDPASGRVTASSKPRRRGRKKSNVDPVTKREMDRLKDRKRCSSYRQRQRNERESLHKEVRVLTAKLHTAKEETALSSGWEVCAQRQLEARLESENEQTRLCEAIRARAAYIREFQELAQRRNATVLGVEAVDTPCEQQNATEYTVCTSIPFCKLFVQDLDTIYAQTDDCLQAFDEVTPGQDSTSSIKVWKADSEAGCFQFMERKELQCNFDQACQTLWDAAQLPHRQEGRHEFKGVPDPDNTSVFNFRVTTRLASGQIVSAVQRFLSRRYRTSDHMVFVWQSYMDGEGMFTGMRAGETGWDVLTRSEDTSGVSKVTRKTFIWHTPMHMGGTAMSEQIAKEFATMTIGCVSQDCDEIAKRFQEIRLDDVAA
ncbi:hypothetical protein PI124_g15921 [Phytophthora idaei]|nr:hypothetical protein PI124_g15921 [Phytophthora idaei]